MANEEKLKELKTRIEEGNRLLHKIVHTQDEVCVACSEARQRQSDIMLATLVSLLVDRKLLTDIEISERVVEFTDTMNFDLSVRVMTNAPSTDKPQ